MNHEDVVKNKITIQIGSKSLKKVSQIAPKNK